MYNTMKKYFQSFIFLATFLLVFSFDHTHGVLTSRSSSSSSGLVSDGFQDVQQPTFLFLKGMASSTDHTCEEIFGLFPCSKNVFGNIFLILVYGYFIYLAAKYLSDGSEDLLEILGPGLVGGLILPFLSSLPDALIILASGLAGSKAAAQIEVSVGMGLLAGSTVMGLTILWGSCVLAGKCDIVDSSAKDNQDTKGFSLTGSGVSTDVWTCYAAMIMVISIFPFIVVQIAGLFRTGSQTRGAVLISLSFSIFLLLAYSIYQVVRPRVQRRRLAYAKHKHVMAGILRHLKMSAMGKLLREDGTPNQEVIKRLFETLDEDKNEQLSASEIRALIIGINFEDIFLEEDDVVKRVMKEFDTNNDNEINLDEFTKGITKWLNKAKVPAESHDREPNTLQVISHFHMETKRRHDILGELDDEKVEKIGNAGWTAFIAVLFVLFGMLVAAAFAHPFVESINNFSTATSIPPFFVGFVVLPFVRSGEALSAVIFAGRKRKRTASLTFSQIYAAVTISHVLCLSVFLGLVYTQDLTWDFSPEVFVISIVSLVIGVFASCKTTFPLWSCLVAFALYPIAAVLVYILNYMH